MKSCSSPSTLACVLVIVGTLCIHHAQAAVPLDQTELEKTYAATTQGTATDIILTGKGYDSIAAGVFDKYVKVVTINLDNNKLVAPQKFSVFSTLSNLLLRNIVLSRNGIKSVEFEASDTTKLKLVTSLDLSVNVIDTLGVGYPDYAPALTTLNLANNSIATLKVDQFSPVLTSIDLSANKIASIEAGTFKTPELLTLKMAANQLSAFPIAAFTGATKVSTLDLSANKFIAFPTEAVNGLATTLTTLDLSQNQITELKGEFLGNNNGIKTLKLVNNRINSINLDVFNSANRCFNSIDFTGNPIFNGLTVTSDTTNAACKKITCKSSNSLKDVCTYNSSGRLATGSLWLLVTFVGAYFIRH